MSVITRFAPSPTGYLHIGSARTALFNYLFSRNRNGKFLLRIEDTDKNRSTKQAIDAIFKGLDWLEISYDDKPVLQSNNIARHQQVAEEMLANGRAYYCYTTQEELKEMREYAEKKGQIFRFISSWRNKQPSHATNIKPVIRIKAPIEGETVINDLIQGQITVKNSEIDDLIMLRSDGTPTYMLAVVVDDHDMEITHIIRGDDHLTNAFRQKIIYQAMNWKIPEFAHIPLIYGSDGHKMSKRHGATAVFDYAEMGYIAKAIRNYLLRLGWSHNDDEIISDRQAIEWFNLENIGKSPARFDFAKLNSVNRYYIKNTDNQSLLKTVMPIITANRKGGEDIKQTEINRILKALDFVKEKPDTINQLADLIAVYFDDFAIDFNKISDKENIIIAQNQQLLIMIRELIIEINDFSGENLHNIFTNFASKNNLKMKDFGPLIRIAITGSSSSSGGIIDNLAIIGKELSLSRINKVIK
jgi:glutamyl-tRNA synthetase